jgi:hypothetical protein
VYCPANCDETKLISHLELLTDTELKKEDDGVMDLFPNEQNFDLDKSRQTLHHSLKEHHNSKLVTFPKFRCEML